MKNIFCKTASVFVFVAVLLGCCGVYAAETELSGYEPQRIIVTPMSSASAGVNISWVNPVNPLSDVKIYKVNGITETLVQNDNISTASSVIATYQDATVVKGTYATYKIRYEFVDGQVREIYTSGAAGILPKLVFSADPGLETDYAWYVNSFRVRNIEGHKSVTDQISTIGKAGTSTGALHIVSNDAAANDKHVQIDFYGGLGSNADASKNKAPGTYRLTCVSKGTQAYLDLFVVKNSGEATRMENTLLANGAEWSDNITAEFTIPADVTDMNRIVMRVKNITPGELLIDSIRLEKKDVSGEWTTITMQEFDYINDTMTSDIGNPAEVTVDYTTDMGAVLSWASSGEPEFNSGRTNDAYYGIYTKIYEEIDGELYLRAVLPDRGNSENKIVLNDFVTGNYVLKTQRLHADGEHDYEGTGAYSDGIKVTLPDYITDGIEFKNSLNQPCDSLSAGTYTVLAKVRNLNLEMKGQLIAVLLKNDKMYRIYKTNSTEIAKTPFGQPCTTISIENVEIPDVDLSDYKLRLMLWDDAFGDMNSLCDGKVITK